MVRNQVCKRAQSRSIDFVAILRRVDYASSNMHYIIHISSHIEIFDIEKNSGNFPCNRCVYVGCEHQNFMENSDHGNIFEDLQAGQDKEPSF